MSATTYLFVPGDRPDRFGKAVASGADVVIVDLEDAVAPADKDAARAHVGAWLAAGGRAMVRINAPGTPWFADDVEVMARYAVPVMVPKAENPGALVGFREVTALVETGFGGKLCVHPAQIDVVRAGFAPTDAELAWARKVVMAGESVSTVDGQLVDRPVLERARRLLG